MLAVFFFPLHIRFPDRDNFSHAGADYGKSILCVLSSAGKHVFLTVYKKGHVNNTTGEK
jgi:hypothetical protein